MLVIVTVLAWGATFPVAKSALASIDGFWVSAVLAALVANSLHIRRRVAARAGTAS